MPNLSTLKTLTTSRNFWYIIIALAAFISVAIYVYSNYIAPTIQPAYVPYKEFVKEKASQSQIHLFYVDWCPHSKLAKEEWFSIVWTLLKSLRSIQKTLSGSLVTPEWHKKGMLIVWSAISCRSSSKEESSLFRLATAI